LVPLWTFGFGGEMVPRGVVCNGNITFLRRTIPKKLLQKRELLVSL